MKLKRVVQTMIVVGAIGVPILSVATAAAQLEQQSATKDSMHQDHMINIVNRNQSNAAGDPSTILPDWSKYIILSGSAKASLSAESGSSEADFHSISGSANLFIDSQVHDWALAHLSLAYGNDFTHNKGELKRSQAKSIFLKEATITLANFNKSPFWLTAGRQTLLFGSADHPSTDSLAENLSDANQIAITTGYVAPNGLNANIYGFQSFKLKNKPSKIRGAGANVGFRYAENDFSYNINIGYINNLNASNCIHSNDGKYEADNKANDYARKIDGIAAHLGVNSGPFSLVVDFVSALDRFDVKDLRSGSTDASPKGAVPWAYIIEPSYAFKTNQYDSKVFVGYQQSGDAVNVQSKDVLGGYWMPQYRYLAGYSITLIKNLKVTAQYQHDIDYRAAKSGRTNKSGDTISASLKLAF